MNENPDNLTALEIDVAQWRRDIRTFVETTFKELSEVNEQLASRFSRSGDDKPSISLTDRMARKTNEQMNKTDHRSSHTEGTLSELKQKIASRIGAEREGN
jgi:hypothetical protein